MEVKVDASTHSPIIEPITNFINETITKTIDFSQKYQPNSTEPSNIVPFFENSMSLYSDYY